MPSRLPVARQRPRWAAYGVIAPLLALATALTWALPPLSERTPFMLYFGLLAVVAIYGGVGPAALYVACAVVIVEVLFLRTLAEAPLVRGELLNDAGFIAVSALITWLAHRASRSARTERAQREWCEVTLRSIGDGVIVTDAAGRVLTMNAAAEMLTGWPESEAAQQRVAKVFQILNQSTRASVENPIERVFREGRTVGLANHTVLIARDGRELPIDDSGAPIRSEDGRIVGAVLVFRDITERYEAERERALLLESERAAHAEAQAANRAKDEFLAVLSHEMRTPLNSVLGWAQVLRHEPLPPAAERGIEVIERNARRQASLIEDVLDVSRIVSGRLRLEQAHVDMGQVVEGAVDALRPMLEAKGLALDVHGDCGGSVLGDTQRLQQVVTNLLSNAVKFTAAGGRIEVRMEHEGPLCAVTVSDTGIGIASDFLPLVFERFRQEDSGNTRRYGGLGLGLTIVRHLVEMHGGTVSAHSDGSGRGARFTVRLPLASERSLADARREAPASAIPMPDLRGARILAVDDDADARDFLSEVLRRAGAEVRSASSADEALDVLRAFDAEVLVSDIEMPDADGYTLLTRIREAGYTLPAVAMTAHSSGPDRLRALTEGFQQHVPKPVEPAELLLVVAHALPAARARTV
jgi:PAS domain S-box-containing protein